MGLSDTARLIASLELQDKFSKNAALFDRTVGGMERRASTFSRIGSQVGSGLSSATQNLTRIGVVGAGLLTVAVTNGVRELEKLESATAQTNAVIASTQGVAGQTAESIRNLAEKYEGLNATIDDKVIQSGENLLLTFTNIDKKAFEPALVAALNLNQALGGGEEGLQGTIIQVGKALQDPIRGLTNLRRVGVNFSEQQKTQIKDLIAQNRLYDAQQIILAELTTEFGGSFAAAGDTATGKFARFRDVVEDSQAALATGFLPVLEKVADKVGTFLADPATVQRIEAFGGELAKGFDRLLEIGGQLPWESIGDSLQIAGTGAKAVLDAFLGLPPWVQTAVLTGWGLNKLTGGALTGIAGTIGKAALGGLVGGMRGATPANPVFVSQVGGVGGPGGVPGGGAPLLGLGLGPVVLAAATIGAVAAGAAFAISPDRSPLIDRPGGHLGPGDLPQNKPVPITSPELPKLVSQFERSRATSEQLRSLTQTEGARTAATQERIRALLAPLPFGIGALVAKDFSPTTNVSVSTVVNVTNSATQITQSIRRLLTANATRLTDAGVGL